MWSFFVVFALCTLRQERFINDGISKRNEERVKTLIKSAVRYTIDNCKVCEVLTDVGDSSKTILLYCKKQQLNIRCGYWNDLWQTILNSKHCSFWRHLLKLVSVLGSNVLLNFLMWDYWSRLMQVSDVIARCKMGLFSH